MTPAQSTQQLQRSNPEEELILLLLSMRCQCPGPGLTLRARAVPGLLKETCRQKARLGEKKKSFGTTVRDLNFQLHFPAVMSSYFQGIQIMQPRCLSGYHFKGSKFSSVRKWKNPFIAVSFQQMILPSAFSLISKYKIKIKMKSNLKWQTNFFPKYFYIVATFFPLFTEILCWRKSKQFNTSQKYVCLKVVSFLMPNSFSSSSTSCTLNTEVKLLFKTFAQCILQNATYHFVIFTRAEGL